MILLNGHSLTALKKIDTEAQTLTLKERESTCDFTPADMTDITVNSWFLDETDPGSGIVWRVKSIQQAYTTNTPTIKLEHIINTLRDRILFGEITPETIAGAGATTCTAKQAINYILSQQSDWVLDESSFAYGSVSNPYKFDGDSLYDALASVTRTLNEAWWSYDLSVYPFKLKITVKQSGIASAMRQNRNIKTISKTIDRSAMYTRFYPIGKDDLHISGNYVSRNESTYGIISKVEVNSSLTTTAELTAWANERLNKHAQPAVTVMVDGLELADATGESLDAMKLGRICQIPLPEFGTTIEERIVELYYQDKKYHPEVVRVTLGNQQEDLAHIIADEIKEGAGPSGAGRGGGGGRGGARQAKEDHAWFEDTDEHVAMVAEGIVGVDAYGNPNWTRLSQLIVDGAGIHGNVTSLLDGELYHQSNIEMNEDKISLVVGRYNNQNYIKAAEIVTSINDADEGVVHISADHVYMGTVGNEQPIDVVIDGKLTTTLLASEIARISSVSMIAAQTSGNIVCGGALSVGASLAVNQNYGITNGGSGYLSSIVLNGSSAFNDCVIDAEVNNNTLTISFASGKTPVTFSKAVSLSGAWSGTTYSVSATAGTISGTAPSTTVYLAVEGSANPGASIYAKIYKENPSVAANQIASTTMTLTEDVSSKEVTLSANSLTKGKISTQNTWNSGKNSVTISSIAVYGSPAASATAISVKATASNGQSDIGSVSITNQRTDAYNAGYNQALADAGVPNGGVVYTATGWKQTMWDAPVSGANQYYNCATGCTNHQLTKK